MATANPIRESDAVELFDSKAKLLYQQMNTRLMDCVDVRKDAQALKYHFRRVSKAASGSVSAGDILNEMAPNSVDRGQLIECTLQAYRAYDYSSKLSQRTLNFSVIESLAKSCMYSIMRDIDNIIGTAISTTTADAGSVHTVGTGVGGANSGLNTAKLRAAVAELKGQGIDPGSEMITLACSANQEAQLMADERFASSDFNRWMPYNYNESPEARPMPKYLGIAKIVNLEDGLGHQTTTGTTEKAYLFVKDAVGYAQAGMDNELNYVPERQAWLAVSDVTAGATQVDATGIVEITTTRAATS